jgi:predicted nuclease of restriction endonuclease-like (RecB) superfamily
MVMAKRTKKSLAIIQRYDEILGEIGQLLESARRASARSVNAIMTATYWEVGRRIVEFEQAGEKRAEYGMELLKRLAQDLTKRFGRGFSERNLRTMRLFYADWPIRQTLSAKSTDLIQGNQESPTLSGTNESNVYDGQIRQTVSDKFNLRPFPLPWSHYVRLLSVKAISARQFYEQEAIRGGWSIRQLNRQIESQFYERAALSKNKSAMLQRGQQVAADDLLTPEQELKDPYVLEFLELKDEYSESDLEAALIAKLESFLLELGGDFAFIGRQRRLRIDDEWYRIDLLFFHRRLHCLVIIDLKLGKFTHADAGQMHLYLNYARQHWMIPGENPPVGLILCASKGSTLAKYALEGLPNKVLAAEYRTTLPDEQSLAAELELTRKLLENTPQAAQAGTASAQKKSPRRMRRRDIGP